MPSLMVMRATPATVTGYVYTSASGKAISYTSSVTAAITGTDGVFTSSDYTNSFGTDRPSLGPEWAYIIDGLSGPSSFVAAAVDTGHTDFTVEADVTYSSGDDAGIIMINPSGSDYFFWDFGNFWAHYAGSTGGSLQLGVAGAGASSGTHTVKIVKTGQTIELYHDGVHVGTANVTAPFPSDLTFGGIFAGTGGAQFPIVRLSW